MPLKGELLEEQARLLLAIKAETFVRVILKEREFSTRVGKAKVQLVLCSKPVSYPFCAQGDSSISLACQPVDAVIKHHLPGGGRTADFCLVPVVTSSLPRCVEQIGKGES